MRQQGTPKCIIWTCQPGGSQADISQCPQGLASPRLGSPESSEELVQGVMRQLQAIWGRPLPARCCCPAALEPYLAFQVARMRTAPAWCRLCSTGMQVR